MPASDRDLEWLERAFQEYLADRLDALEAAAAALGGAHLVQESLDEWAYRDTDARALYTRTVFVWERVLAQQPITPEALDAAWPGPYVAALDDEAETAASRYGAFLHDLIDSAGADDAERAIAAAGGPKEIEAAVTRWAYRDSQIHADDRVGFVLHRVIAREPIDLDSLHAVWNLRPQNTRVEGGTPDRRIRLLEGIDPGFDSASVSVVDAASASRTYLNRVTPGVSAPSAQRVGRCCRAVIIRR